MQFQLTRQSRNAGSRNAVIFCCDGRYLPFASLAIHTLLANSAERNFDICVVSFDDLTIPDVIVAADIRNCQVTLSEGNNKLPTSDRFSVAAYLRLMLPRLFKHDYDRILYLDCDVMVVGSELDKIFSLDLKDAPLAAVMDSYKLKHPKRPTSDQKAIDQNGPYFNSGVLLFDCKTFEDQKIFEKCMDALRTYGPQKIYFDQTMLNIALRKNWAQLDFAWNWQWAVVRPMFETYVNVQIVHFISEVKPWSDAGQKLPAYYRNTALSFLNRYFPDLGVDKSSGSRTLRRRDVFWMMFRHIAKIGNFVRAYRATGGDISKVVAPQDVKTH